MSEKIVEDDRRYTQVSKGIMVAHDRSALREYEKSVAVERSKIDRINRLEEKVDDLVSQMEERELKLIDRMNVILQVIEKTTTNNQENTQ
jgi:hypothetical protein